MNDTAPRRIHKPSQMKTEAAYPHSEEEPPHDELRLLNCAMCKCEMVGPSTPIAVAEHEQRLRPRRSFGARVKRRPMCAPCVGAYADLDPDARGDA